ncbi:MAG: K+ transport system, NAD-binding component [uncultured archaeon A07HR60]|nr:MAG: K+ transport system, NAD-binding component [uncultured archaeon A07HR60]
MNSLRRRIIGYFGFVAVVLTATAAVYQQGMRVFEGRPRTFLDSFQFAVEMFTTTGFGGDAPWTTPEMQLFVAVMDLVGMALLVGALPVVATPFLQNALSTSVPQEAASSLADHVVICSYNSLADTLITELEGQEISYVLLEPDRDEATDLYEDGYTVIQADPVSTDGLQAAQLTTARALFIDIDDQVDTGIILTAREIVEDIEIVSVVDEPEQDKYHRLAGADSVLSPRSVLGETLAAKVTTTVQQELTKAVDIDGDLQLAEVSIHHGSRLAGDTLAESQIPERTGVNVLGAWFRGGFQAAPAPSATLSPGTVLLVSGQESQLSQFVEMTQSSVRQFGTGDTLVIGHGQVGQTVSSALAEDDISYTIVDKTERPGVDVIGDATDEETLTAAGIERAQTVVIALPDDTIAEFVTLVTRNLAPETEIVARVQTNESVSKMYRAGADYVLSLSRTTGRLSASRILDDRDLLSLDQQMGVARITDHDLGGQTIRDADIRRQTGCTVIALEREETVITDVDPDTTIDVTDTVQLVGADDGIRSFEQSFT